MKTEWVLIGFLLGFGSLLFRFQKITLATTPLLHYSITPKEIRYHGYVLLPQDGQVS